MATPPREGPFVGRDTELAELTARLDAAAAGSGGLVLLSGPAGIGKTRTAEELAGRAPAVIRGRCVDDPGAPPLWPWRQVLRSRPEVRAAVADTLSDVDLLRKRSADPEAARFRFVATATETLLAAAEPAGLLVLLEDLHWADETSLRLLRHLAGELQGSRLLVIGTYRAPAAGIDWAWQRSLPQLLRWPTTSTIPLRPLSEDDVGRYVGGAAGSAEVRELHRRSGGNPLYLRALTWDPATGGAATPGSELRSLVRATLASLPPATLDLLDASAVLGEEVEVGLLAAATGRPVPEVAAGVDVAVAAGVLTAVPDIPGRRRFLHAVVRDAVYADLAPSTREELHRRSAEALEAILPADDPAAGLVAGHWLRAAADPEGLRRAAAWARRAAEAATRSLAFDEAAASLATALDATERAGGSEDDRAELLVELATAEFRAGRSAAALDHAAAASELAGSAGRADLVAAAALAVHDISGPGFPRRLIDLCERALPEADADLLPAVRSRLLSQLASALTDSGRITAAAAPSAEALRLAECSGDPEAVIDAVRARMKAEPEALDREERMRLGRLAIQHGTSTRQPLAALWGHKWRIDVQFEIGDLAAAGEEMAQVAALAQRTRLPLVRWHDLRLRASLAALIGHFPEALHLNEQARALAETALAEDASAAGLSTAFLSQHHLVTEEPPEFAPSGFAVLGAANEVPVVVVSRALLALRVGREEEAASRYEELRPRLGDPDFCSAAGVLVNVLPVVEHFGDAEAARLLRESFDRTPAAAIGAGIYGSGSTAGLLGRLAAVRGEWDRAVSCFEEALEVDLRTGARPSVVLDRAGLAGALVQRGGPGDASRAFDLARQAAAEARRLGMSGPARRAAALSDRAAAGTRAADPLTRREREIAGLVAEALTNRQIAERLFLSERTVESHVRNILAKLGLANRTEIATSAVGARTR